MSRFAKGAKRPNPDKLARGRPAMHHPLIFASLHAAIRGEVSEASLLAHCPPRLNQGQSGSCTRHSLAAAEFTRLSVAGAPLPWVPSPANGYATTHAIERELTTPAGVDLPAFQDNGAELADAIAADAEYGVCPMRGPTPDGRNSDIWTAVDIEGVPGAPPPNVTMEPDVAALEAAATTLITGEYRIDQAASNASDVFAAAINAGYPIYCGFFCDSEFEQLGPNDVAGIPNQNDPAGGGHAVFLVGYRTNAAGEREWLLVNSWGNGWGDDGTIWCSDAWRQALWEAWVIDVRVISG